MTGIPDSGSSRNDRTSQRPGRGVLAVLLFFLGLYGLTFHGYLDVEDSAVVYASTCNLLDHGSLAVGDGEIGRLVAAERFYVVEDPQGTGWYPVYPTLQMLLHVPGLWLGRQLGFLATSQPEDLARLGFASLNVVAGALCAALILLLGRRLGYRPRTAVVTALLGGSATMLWSQAQGTLVDLPLTVLTTSAVLCLISARLPPDGSFWRAVGWLLLAGLAHGMACQLRPAALLLLAPITWFLRPSGLRCLTAFVLPVVAVLLVCHWLDHAVFARPDAASYLGYAQAQPPLLTHSYGLGLHGLLFSDGRGLFVLSPLLLLSVLTYPKFFAEQRRRATLFGGYLLVLTAFFSAFAGWDGGWCWGPRYLMPAVPLCAVLVGHWLERSGAWRRLLTVAVAAASLWIQVLSIAVPYRIYMIVATSAGVGLDQFHFYPRFSPILAHQRILMHKLAGGPDVYSQRLIFDIDDAVNDRDIDVTTKPRPGIDGASAGFRHFAWLRVFEKGHATAAVLGMSSCALAVLFGLWRSLRATRSASAKIAAATTAAVPADVVVVDDVLDVGDAPEARRGAAPAAGPVAAPPDSAPPKGGAASWLLTDDRGKGSGPGKSQR